MSTQTPKLQIAIETLRCPDCGGVGGAHNEKVICYARSLYPKTRLASKERPVDESKVIDVGTPGGFNLVSYGDLPTSLEERLPDRNTGLTKASSASSTALVAPYKVDGSRHSGNRVWASTPTFERLWRETAAARIELVVRPEVAALMRREDPIVRFRYLEPSHLAPPWTPSLVMNLWWTHAMLGNYNQYSAVGELFPWYEGEDPSNPADPMGVRVFKIAETTFKKAGLMDQVTLTEQGLSIFNKRLLWKKQVSPFWGKTKFFIGVPESQERPIEIKFPESWQKFIMLMRAVLGDGADSRMKTMRKIQDHHSLVLSGPFRPRTSNEDPPMYFGHMQEHTSPLTFEDWIKKTRPGLDLFSPELW